MFVYVNYERYTDHCSFLILSDLIFFNPKGALLNIHEKQFPELGFHITLECGRYLICNENMKKIFNY
jgi:hypothetical protein